MTRSKPIVVGSFIALLVACAHSTPRELVAARGAYEEAANGPARQYTPAELHVAKQELRRAEHMYKDRGDVHEVRDQAYIAQRKAELAATLARIELLRKDITAAAQQTRQQQEQAAARTRAELEAAQAALAAERQAREQAEQRATSLNADLARLASVKQDPRGTVITLSGSVLFASNKYTLLPAARERLNQVADALMRGDPNSQFVVEGHTDSRGSVAVNQALSKNRANAVRDYLIERGVPADRITAEGHGSDNPVADNKTADGRANNRRVEIVVKPPDRLSRVGADRPQAGNLVNGTGD
jgi:outer membrane protein OmpA-like peptidoglycan-associated protein